MAFGGLHEISSAPVLSQDDINRFWSKVELTANKERCWLWNGSKRSKKEGRDYGQFSLVNNGKMINCSAHRIAFLISNKTYPEKILRHTCDTPSCVNPNHLIDGTNKENTRDMMDKGRNIAQKGSEHHHAKLTENDVIEMRNKYRCGVSRKELQSEYKIDQGYLSNILNKKRWKHI